MHQQVLLQNVLQVIINIIINIILQHHIDQLVHVVNILHQHMVLLHPIVKIKIKKIMIFMNVKSKVVAAEIIIIIAAVLHHQKHILLGDQVLIVKDIHLLLI